MADNDSGHSFVSGFLLGGIVGAVVGILLAPKTGSETRASLLEQSETLRTRAEELAARVREQVGPTVETVRERVSPVAERVAARVGRGTPVPETDGGPGADALVEETATDEAKEKA